MQAPVPAVGWSSHLNMLPLSDASTKASFLFGSYLRAQVSCCPISLCAIDRWPVKGSRRNRGRHHLSPLADPSSHNLSLLFPLTNSCQGEFTTVFLARSSEKMILISWGWTRPTAQ